MSSFDISVQSRLSLKAATGAVDAWLSQSTVEIVSPSPRFWKIFQNLLIESQAAANLSSDAYLASLAIDNDCELCSIDADFSRYKKLR